MRGNPILSPHDPLPRDRAEGLFRTPWEAQAFAIVEHLKNRGLITAREWADALGSAIRAAQANGDPDTGETYYAHWMTALEKLLNEKNLASTVTIDARAQAWARAEAATPHGKPVELQKGRVSGT